MSAVRRDALPRLGVATRMRQHRQALLDAAGRWRTQPWASALTTLVLALAVLMPVLLGVALDNVRRLAGGLGEAGEISVFLAADTPMARAEALAAQWATRPDVAATLVQSPADGLAEFRRMSDLAAALDVLDENPLPPVVRLRARGAPEPLVEALRGEDGIDSVQFDAAWRERLQAWLAFGRAVLWGLAGLLLLVALGVIGNTVRLDLAGRAAEVALLQSLGADAAYLRRPLAYLGLLHGAAAGALAVLAAQLAAWAVQPAVTTLAQAYGSRFVVHGLSLQAALAVWLATAVLAWLGALAVAGHHVRSTRPVAS